MAKKIESVKKFIRASDQRKLLLELSKENLQQMKIAGSKPLPGNKSRVKKVVTRNLWAISELAAGLANIVSQSKSAEVLSEKEDFIASVMELNKKIKLFLVNVDKDSSSDVKFSSATFREIKSIDLLIEQLFDI